MFKVGETVYLVKSIAHRVSTYEVGEKAVVKEVKGKEVILKIRDIEEIVVVYDDVLRPCPFCGESPSVIVSHDDDFVKVECDYCRASIREWKLSEKHEFCDPIVMAIEQWNSRA